MIPGSRLAAFFGRVVRAESFTLIIAPAIADLQFERQAASPTQHIRNYIGVWQAFCGALWLDLSWNARVWLTRDVRRMVRLQMKRQSEWALSSSNGLFVTANHVGHWVHRDDPALVARLVKHVLDHVGVTTRDLR